MTFKDEDFKKAIACADRTLKLSDQLAKVIFTRKGVSQGHKSVLTCNFDPTYVEFRNRWVPSYGELLILVDIKIGLMSEFTLF